MPRNGGAAIQAPSREWTEALPPRISAVEAAKAVKACPAAVPRGASAAAAWAVVPAVEGSEGDPAVEGAVEVDDADKGRDLSGSDMVNWFYHCIHFGTYKEAL